MRYGELADWILTRPPDFCFCSISELFLMCEQEHENIDEQSFKSRFCQLKKYFERKSDRLSGKPGQKYLYRRIEKCQA